MGWEGGKMGFMCGSDGGVECGVCVWGGKVMCGLN